MRGCLTYFGLFILAIILLISLIGSLLGSSSAFFWAIITSAIIALILYLENQRKRSEKKRQEEALKQERQRALALARNRPNLFTFNPSTDLEDLSSYIQKKDPVKWATAIQKRYEATQAALNDSIMVINDDVDQLYALRKKLHKGIMKDYEVAIQPFKEKLALMEESIPKPRELEVAKNYTFPEAMHPKQIQKSLQQSINANVSSAGNIGSQIGQLISRSGGFSNIQNVNKGEASVLAIAFAIQMAMVAINQKKEVAKKLTEVQKLEADVDKYCVQIAGAIKSLGATASEIRYLRQLHDKHVDYMMQYYDTVKELSEQGKSLEHLEDSEIKAVESFYMTGKQLARLIQVDVMKSTP